MRVDFHTHYIPEHFPDLAEKYGDQGWPTLLHTGPCRAEIYHAGKPYRSIDDRSWEPERRIKDMDAEGIDLQVISPIPITFAYHFSAQAVLELAHYQNDEIARVVGAAPARFIGLGTVPLQDPDLASKEVRRVVAELGLAGVEIGTVVEEKNLDDPSFESFWQTCEQVGAAVFVHPETVLAPGRTSKYRMRYSVGYPTETGIAAAAIVMSGLLDRYPALRICFAHGGGTFPWLLPRLDQTWQVFEEVRATLSRKPSEIARLLTYDTLTYDRDNVRLLVSRLGVDRLVMGSDYPFPLREVPPGIGVDALDTLRPDEREAILASNALRFLHYSDTSKSLSSDLSISVNYFFSAE